MRRNVVCGFLVFILGLWFSLGLMAQVASGAISGKVKDEAGRPIAGASVVVTSAQLQGPRTQASDEDGDFLIPYLPPGADYSVNIQAQGYNRVVQSNVRVMLSSTTSLDVTLTSGGQEVKVLAEPSILDMRHTQASSNLTQDEMEALPIGRHFYESFYLVPNVVDSGMHGVVNNPGVGGSTATENMYLINGLNITDPVGGILFGAFNYNFVREISVNTAGLGAEWGTSTGGLFSVLTKSGSNEFHGELFGYYTDHSFSANANSVDPTAKMAQPSSSYDYGFDLGGPIIKDRLWFFVGFNPTYDTRRYAGASAVTNVMTGQTVAFPYSYDNSSRNWIGLAKFNYRLNDDHNLELTYLSTPAHSWLNEGLNNLLDVNGTIPSVDPGARKTRRYISGYNIGLKWYANWTQNFYMETEIANVANKGEITPWDKTGYGLPQIMSYDWAPNLSVGSGIGDMYWDSRYSTQFDSKVTYLVHRHEIKFGVQGEDMKWDSWNGYTGGVEYSVAGAFPGASPVSPRLKDYAYVFASSLQNPHTREYGRYLAAFAQDAWSVTDNLNLSYGVRWERNELLPLNGQHYAFDSWAPRLGLTWDFVGQGKSKMYLNWGRYYEHVPMAATYTMDPGHERYYTTTYLGQVVSQYTFGAIPTRVAPGTKNQYNDEFLVGAEYELGPDFVVGFNALYRSLGRVLEDTAYINDLGTISFYLNNPGTSTWPAVMNRWAAVFPDYERFANPIRNYSAYTLTANKRVSDRWAVNASYTYSLLKGNYEGGSGGYSVDSLSPTISTAYDYPEHIYNMNRYGWLPQDVRSSFKVQGSYRFDWGLAVGVNIMAQTGRPLDKRYQYPLSGPGSGTLFAAPRGSDRLPGLWQLDLHAEYAFKIWKSNLALFADVFNVTNRQTATAEYSYYYLTPASLQDIFTGNLHRDPNWGHPTALQAPRYLRLGAKWSF